MDVLLLWILFLVITPIAAKARGRSFIMWFIWGALIGPFALLLVLIMRNKRVEREMRAREKRIEDILISQVDRKK